MRQVWQFYPYENSLVTVRATGKIVREALERSAECMVGPGRKARAPATALEGAEYQIDLSRPPASASCPCGAEAGIVRRRRLHRGAQLAPGGRGRRLRDVEAGREAGEKGNVRQMLVADARAHPRLTLEPTRNWTVTGLAAPRPARREPQSVNP